ncbi:MAG: c-type cytochrome [Flavobacteriaceae bacterium]
MDQLYNQLVRRLSILLMSLMASILLIAFFLFNYENFGASQEKFGEAPLASWNPVKLILENDKANEQVKQGFYLVSESSRFMGPLVTDAKARFSGNNLSCTNCHLNGGTLSGSASWIGVTKRFPQFRGRENKIGTIEERINGCMERSMNGQKLPEKGPLMTAIIAYMKWINTALPKLNKKEIKGYPPIKIPETAVDLNQGKMVYEKECALCHGEKGKGIRYAENRRGYQYPPLWGEDSYNDGAGMHRVLTAAAFIKSNMPYLQADWENPKLTDEEAYHVAGYINSFQRPLKQNKSADFPDRKRKPVSTPYGPWADNFSAEQHKFGPFPPIIDFYQATFGLTKTK